jgi:hypothetical protein
MYTQGVLRHIGQASEAYSKGCLEQKISIKLYVVPPLLLSQELMEEAVLCCNMVIVKMPNMFMNEEYVHMHFIQFLQCKW